MAATALATGLSDSAATAPVVDLQGADDVSRSRIVETLAVEGIHLNGSDGADVVVLADTSERFDPRTRLDALCESLPDTPVIVVAADESGAAVQGALRSGAAGYVVFERLAATLGPCLRAVASGQLSIPQERRSELQKPALTTREKQTLALVVMGMRNCEIAKQLYLAESTVKSHLSSAFAKLGVRSRNEAAALILDPRAGIGTGILTIPSGDPAPRP